MTTKTSILNTMADEARHIAKTTRIDLTAFLALSSEARAARWRQWPLSAKQDAVIQQIEALGYDWDTATVASWVAKYDAKWEVASPESDLVIPAAADILARATDDQRQAQLHGDLAGANQLNRLRMNITRGARLTWCLGDLLIQSVNNPGQVYSVNRSGCTCKNGQAGRAQCWHVALYDLLLDMRDTEAETADMEADAACDPPGENPLGDEEGDSLPSARAFGARLAQARSRYLVAA